MNDIALIEKAIKRMPRGKPFFAESFSPKYPVHIIRRILKSLIIEGAVVHVARGIFVRPRTSRYLKKGEYLIPKPREIIKLISKKTGEIITANGFAAENYVGLSNQIPLRPIYYTTGRSRVIKMTRGANIRLIHINPKKIVLPGTITCLVVIALWERDREAVTPQIIKKIHQRLTSDEYIDVLKNLDKMPGWMRNVFMQYQNMKLDDPELEEDPNEYWQG